MFGLLQFGEELLDAFHARHELRRRAGVADAQAARLAERGARHAGDALGFEQHVAQVDVVADPGAYGKVHGPTGARIGNDIELCNALLEAKGVACVPGSAFGEPRSLRISYTCPTPQLMPGMERIEQFFAELQ